MAFLDQHPGLGFPAAAGLGLLIGSFLNVVILRLPKRMEWQWRRDAREILELPDIYEPPPPGIVVEPSHDPVTGDKLKWWENIPLFSWLMLRGKSRYSGKPISLQYPLVELLTSILCVASVWRFGFGWQGFGAIVLSCFLVAMSGIDLRHKLLPDQLTLPLMWLGLVGSMDNLYMPAKPALLGAAVGYVSLWTVWWLFKQLTGKEGMGHGDFKLLAALGAWCGLKGILPIILISSLVGAVLGSIWLFAKGRDRATPIPFGPYLAIAGWVVFFWGNDLVDGYLRFAGLR
ncbi:prepilin peptidase [Xanthomonas campestris]|uniref:prepilin peptidase n=1 Tax=Xanthomonas campestris TaxID=339 RepID=UPI001CBC899C|nr:A24 family peptidase [Xanthomonas campestris]MCC5049315.1 A24 family peptidase [Xanthomonas campestris]MCC5057559.1 A24 family peptidase [Xanthomonas campestris]MCC5061630.1 A24 family peptidase [Xanthomonas campestris]MDO0789679.1 A24 family peptidase [Xanthomonas campestris pv. campestris]MEA9479294.1 A24 family peptidase [Xanthomonas campestris]